MNSWKRFEGRGGLLRALVLGAAACSAFPAAAGAQGGPQIPEMKKISLDEQNRPAKEVFEHIAKEAGVNIRVQESIQDVISVRLFDVRWLYALQAIAQDIGARVEQVEHNVYEVTRPPKVSMEFKDTDIRKVLTLIAQLSNNNIVISPAVRGSVTMTLKDVPWLDALVTVAETNGFTVVKVADNLYRVVDRESVKAQLKTKRYALKYIMAPIPYKPTLKSRIAQEAGGSPVGEFPLLKALEKVVSTEGKVLFDGGDNAFIVTDIPPKLEEIEQIIREADVPPLQVLLDVRFMTTKASDDLNYGVDWTGGGFAGSLSFGTLPNELPWNDGRGFEKIFVPGRDPGAPFDTATIAPATYGTLSFSETKLAWQILQTKENQDILQAPRLIALDNQPATIFIGEKRRFVEINLVSSQSGTVTGAVTEAADSPVDIGFQLLFLPHIIPETREVRLTVIPEFEELIEFQEFNTGEQGAGTLLLPQVRTTSLMTSVILKDNHTMVLGGFKTVTKSMVTRKVPVLGDIPVLRWFFLNKDEQYEDSLLTIFVNVRIVDNYENVARDLRDREARYKGAARDEAGAALKGGRAEPQDTLRRAREIQRKMQ